MEGGPAVLLLASICSGQRWSTAGAVADSGDDGGEQLGLGFARRGEKGEQVEGAGGHPRWGS